MNSLKMRIWRLLTIVVGMRIVFYGLDCPAFAGDPIASHDSVVVGYLSHNNLSNWSVDQIGPVTDLVYFDNLLASDGTLKAAAISPAHLANLRAIKQATDCRIFVCIEGDGPIRRILQTCEKR